MERELQTTKHIRALMLVRDPERTSEMVCLARDVAEKALLKMDKLMDEEDLTVDEILRTAATAGKLAIDYTKVMSDIRKLLDEDAAVRLMMEQIDQLEKAHKRLMEGNNEVLDAEWQAEHSPGSTTDAGTEGSGSPDVLLPGGPQPPHSNDPVG